MTSNDKAWELIFTSENILDALKQKPSYSISAKTINEIGKREARLMAKFDTKETLPKIFKDHSLNMNATSNGNYIIFRDEGLKSFLTLPSYKGMALQKFSPNLDFKLDTLEFSARMSESNAIDFAHHSTLLSAYSGQKSLRLTTRGRFFSDPFSFELPGAGRIDVNSVQIEVDAGYEGENEFLIIEAKSSTRDSFNIRQLYYPYKHFENKTKKKIRTILLSFSNGVYYFTEINFSENYHDYKIISTSAYEVIIDATPQPVAVPQPVPLQITTPVDVPVPQADNIDKVIDVIAFLSDKPADKFDIAERFEFDDRQGDYYGNAGRYLGLVLKENNVFKIAATGEALLNIKNRDKRNTEVAKAMAQTKLFNDLLTIYFKNDQNLTDEQIIERLEDEGLTGTTPARRRSTIRAWITWLIKNLPPMFKINFTKV